MAVRDRGTVPPDARNSTVDARSRERYTRARALQRWRSDAVLTLRWSAGLAALAALGTWFGIHRRALPPWPFPPAASAIVLAVGAVLLVFSVHSLRHRTDIPTLTLPEPHPPMATMYSPDYYIGHGWSEEGAQAGDALTPDAVVLDPHAYIRGLGMQNSVLASGMPGTGKTAGIVQKIIAQGVRKFPAPPPLVRAPEGLWCALPAWGSPSWVRTWLYATSWRKRLGAGRLRSWMDRRYGGPTVIAAALDPLLGAAYGGIETEADAQLRYAELDAKHKTMRPVLLVFNPKAEERDDSLAEFVRAHASADSPERLAQVRVISPDLGTSIAMFDLRRESADLGDSVKRAIDIIDGEGDNFWAQNATALLTYVIAVLRATRPGRVNWHEVLRICGDQGVAQALAQEGLALQQEQLVAEREGKPHMNPRLDHNALLGLAKHLSAKKEDWDRVTSRILALGRYILGGDLRRVLAPEVATYGTWEGIFDEGGIVVIDLPVARFGSVSRASCVLLLNAFISAATDYGARTNASERRRSIVILDEAHLFLSPELERATAMARAADLCFVFGVQTFAQLDAGGKTMRQTLLTNIGSKFSFRESDGIAALQIARTHGSREEWVADETMSESLTHVEEGVTRVGFAQSVNQAASERSSRREVLRFAPEILMGLDRGECVAQVTDGRTIDPARRLRTPRCQDIEWLRVTQPVPVAGRPPIPLLEVRGTLPNAVALDALNLLRYQEDPEREPLLAAHVIRADRLEPATGLVLWTPKFGFVLDRDALPLARHILGPAFKNPMRTDTTLALPAPYVILADVAAAHELQRLLQIGFPRPLPIAEASKVLGAPGRASPMLPDDPDMFVGLRGSEWMERSAALHEVLDAGRGFITTLRAMEKGSRVLLEDEWREALASSWPSGSEDDSPAARPTNTPPSGNSDNEPQSVPAATPLDHFLKLLKDEGAAQQPAAPAAPPGGVATPPEPALQPSLPTPQPNRPSPTDATLNPAPPTPTSGSLDSSEPGVVERGADIAERTEVGVVVDGLPRADGAATPRTPLKPGSRARVGKVGWIGRGDDKK